MTWFGDVTLDRQAWRSTELDAQPREGTKYPHIREEAGANKFEF